MDTWYWIVEYGKVFVGYFFLMFLWPSVVFNGYLRRKTKTYRFSFCVTVQIVLINTVVLLLGFFHILYQNLVIVIFYGTFAIALIKNITKYSPSVILKIKKMSNIRYIRLRIKEFFWDLRHKVSDIGYLRMRSRELRHKASPLVYKYGILCIVLLLGILYFSYGAFQVHSYGFGDLYVHHQWVYNLIEGNIFSGGIYPEAMHCFIYCMNTLFGIRIDNCLLFLQGIHVVVVFLSAFVLLRKVMHSQYTPAFVLMLFLILDLANADQIQSMFRLQITLPQEFGIYTVFLCAFYLLRFLENTDHALKIEKKRLVYIQDENLFLFMMSLAAAAMIYFFTVITAFIMCVSFCVFFLKRIIRSHCMAPLLTAAVCGIMVAVTPMAAGYISGIPFHDSWNQTLHAMSGEESRNLRKKQSQPLETETKSDPDTRSKSIPFIDVPKGIWKEGYAALYGAKQAIWILIISGASIWFCWKARRKPALKNMIEICRGYPPAILISCLYILLYAAPMIGLPDIIPDHHFFVPGHMMLLAVMVMPVDVAFSMLEMIGKGSILKPVSLLSAAGIYGIVMVSGHYHGFLFYELTRYNSAVSVTNSIIESFPKHSYTIVAPTDELFPIINNGWHEELLAFVENCNSQSYTLPSEYVFIYVEKKPIWYAQMHFFEGYPWLGQEKYLEPYWDAHSKRYPDGSVSQSPQIRASEISEAEAKKNLPSNSSAWEMYTNIETRTILESKAYEWCQKFSELHPNKLNIYYEDDDFVCYYFRQEAKSLYNLGIE